MGLAGCALALLAAASTWAHALSPDEADRLAHGEVVIAVTPDPQGATGRIAAAIDIGASPQAVWSTMLDCARAPGFIKGLQSCRILERDPAGRWDVREHRVQWAALLPTVRSVFRSDYEAQRTIRFRKVEGDIDLLEGEWRLEPLKGGTVTRLTYNARIGINLPLPGPLVRAMVEADVPRTLEALRHEVLRGARS